jgi:hypothetical protein
MSAEPTPHALMLRDTVIDLRIYLAGQTGETEFDKGYQMGLAHAIDTLKHQCEAFGLRDDLGWMEPDVAKWLR